MKYAFARRVAACSLAGVFALGVSNPGFAAEGSAADPSQSTLLTSGTKHVQHLAKIAPPASRLVAKQEGAIGGYDEPGSFFKTKRGVALLVLAGAGVGYMWYSKVHDRIHSEARAQRAD